MGKIPPSKVQEIIFSSSEKKASSQLTALLKQGLIKKIAPRLYTSSLKEEPALIIKRNWYRILAHLFPEALLSHRSALEFKPTSMGHIFLTYTYTTNVSLPGLTIHLLKGPKPMEGDQPFFENLFASHEARAFLENLQQTRKQGEESKSLPVSLLEERLEAIVQARGEQGLNALRDKAKNISQGLQLEKEFKKLNSLISSLLATGNARNLTSPVAVARALGEPFDPVRINVFEGLYEALAGKVFPEHKTPVSRSNYNTVAFFESYFSNYIEGTEFTITEAKEIILTQTPLPTRDEDSHDILGTYRIVSDKKEMAVCPAKADEFINRMRNRHAVLLHSRTSKKPGEFKDRNNRAGDTEFVDWRLVNGTLLKGFDWYTLLKDPFAKAVYMMFLVSEVHPFLDGNGRLARVMMNAELSAKGLSKIVIPTVYREDYMGALRKLTRQQIADPYIRMMQRAYEFSSTLLQENIDEMEQYLEACDAFKEPGEGKLKFDAR
ncbi:MAG: Fic family protein [Cyclobacteriaceae bacterium]|nr:Fic family protein [Cyclobacteriaceae bacterium]UYN86785.1 MAG: Fic family protein [Cyclobacteriaceae bacterium]